MKHNVAVIAGDGIGPEVLAEGIKVLNAVADTDGNFSFDFISFIYVAPPIFEVYLLL